MVRAAGVQHPEPDRAREADCDLPAILVAWEQATERLRDTHEALRNEVRRLTRELEAKNQQLARQSRLADLGQMASHVAHEVRNGLVPLTLYLSLLRRTLADRDDALSLLDKLAAGFAALEVTVNDLLQFTSDRQPQFRRFPVAELIDEVIESVQPQLQAQHIRVVCETTRSVELTADRDMVRRALLNLIFNALEVMPDGGQLDVGAWRVGDRVEIEVADTGPGLSDEVRSRLFEPFFTTKPEGTGLGLTIVERIVTAHGGTIRAMNCPQGGAAFILSFRRQVLEAAA